MLNAAHDIRRVSDDWQRAFREAVDDSRRRFREAEEDWVRLHRNTLKWMQIFGTFVVLEAWVIFGLLLVIERS